MLVLSRKPSQKIIIETPEGRQIELTALSGCCDKLRLGFKADPAIRIYRLEVADRFAEPGATEPQQADGISPAAVSSQMD